MSGVNQQLFYLGTQDSSSSTTDENSIEFVIRQLMNERTHIELVQVQSVTNTPGQFASVGQVNVLPLVNDLDGYGNAIQHDTVSGLSYFRYAGGNNAILLDPQVGDIGIAVIADKDPSVIKATQAQGNPGSRGRSRREYGFYFGLHLGNSNPNQYVQFLSQGINIVDDYGNKIQMANNGVTITTSGGSMMLDTSGNLHVSGNIFWNTSTTATDAAGHVHSGVQGGTGDTGAPVAGT